MIKSHGAFGLFCCMCPIARWVGLEPTSLCLEPNYYLLLKPHTGFIVFFIVFYPLNYHRLRPWLPKYAAPQVDRPVGTRTRDLLCVGQPFSPLNYRPICFLIGTGGLEPPISCVSDRRLNQLGYVPAFWPLMRRAHPNGSRTRISTLRMWRPEPLVRWGVNGSPGIRTLISQIKGLVYYIRCTSNP